MTRLQVSRAHYPVTALGPGIRAGIWVQGCAIGCSGCLAQDTWASDPTREVAVEVLVNWLDSLPGPVHGVTISGGEPFAQPEALQALLRGIHEWRAGRDPAVDILAYSGYPVSRLRRQRATERALALCDAVIAGPYVERRNVGGHRWMGSTNQRLVTLSALGAARFAADGGTTAQDDLQVAVSDGRVLFIGIPSRDDLDRIGARLRAAGISYDGQSWPT